MSTDYTLDLVTQQLATANHEREAQHAKIKDLTDALDQSLLDLDRRDERIKDLEADVEACHRTISAGTQELEDARAIIQDLTGKLEESKRAQDTIRRGFDAAHRENNELQARFTMLRSMFANAIGCL